MASVKEVKQRFLACPALLANYLETWFSNISINRSYISCGRSEDSNPQGITIYLKDNDGLYLNDYSRNVHEELFAYLIEERNETFSDLMHKACAALELDSNFHRSKRIEVFGGIFEGIGEREEDCQVQTYPESIMDQYDNYFAQRFMRDHITIETQRQFGVKFWDCENSIVFPIRNEMGEIIGVKARVNQDHPIGSKYWYPIPTQMSQTLYGYSQNYLYLQNNEVYVFEAEKSVMQCHSMGIYNAVAVGSSSVSNKQIELLLALNPKKIIIAFDEGSQLENIHKIAQSIMKYVTFRDVIVEYIDMDSASYILDIPSKSSPSDLGKQTFLELQNYRERIDIID